MEEHEYPTAPTPPPVAKDNTEDKDGSSKD